MPLNHPSWPWRRTYLHQPPTWPRCPLHHPPIPFYTPTSKKSWGQRWWLLWCRPRSPCHQVLPPPSYASPRSAGAPAFPYAHWGASRPGTTLSTSSSSPCSLTTLRSLMPSSAASYQSPDSAWPSAPILRPSSSRTDRARISSPSPNTPSTTSSPAQITWHKQCGQRWKMSTMSSFTLQTPLHYRTLQRPTEWMLK